MQLPSEIRDQARDEAYYYNDVEAFRHAYVSGVFTQIYGEHVADVFGRLNEFHPGDLYSNSNDPSSLNMDLWNNAIGRKYGKTTKSRRTLLKKIHTALDKREMITSLEDSRMYTGTVHDPINKSKPVIVIGKADSGRNETFFDLIKNEVFSRIEFVSRIKKGQYPGYFVKIVQGVATPVSRPDKRRSNNLF